MTDLKAANAELRHALAEQKAYIYAQEEELADLRYDARHNRPEQIAARELIAGAFGMLVIGIAIGGGLAALLIRAGLWSVAT